MTGVGSELAVSRPRSALAMWWSSHFRRQLRQNRSRSNGPGRWPA